MKCPTCTAWASVKDTRQTPANTTRRRYECANGHRFTTLERVNTPKPDQHQQGEK